MRSCDSDVSNLSLDTPSHLYLKSTLLAFTKGSP